MKIIHPFQPTLIPCLSLLALWLASGCATTSTGYKQAEKTGDKMAALRKDIADIQIAINRTTQAMDAVVAQAQTNPRKPFSRFSKAVTGLEGADQKAQRRADEMKVAGIVFFEQWAADIDNVSNPEVKQLALQRKSQLDSTFQQVRQATVQVSEDLKPWISDVRDLHNFLSNDLTPAGIASVSDLIARTRVESDKVKKSLDTLTQELNRVETAITPADAKPGKTTQSAMAR